MNYSAGTGGGYPNPPRNKRRAGKKKQRSKPFSIFLSVLLVILIIGGFAICGALTGGYIAIIRSIPDMGLVGIEPRTYTSVILDSSGSEISKLHGEENREYATLDTIPKDLQHAIIAIEDERFYEHDGVDVRGFARAVYSTITKTQLQGGSTITQQLIKNNVTNVSRNTVRTKLKEQYLAIKYEKELREKLGSKQAAKDYILELYLNTIGLGHGYNGVKVAAKSYFNKDVSELDLAECACIAGITNNPSLYSPRTQPDNNKNRQSIILQYMLNQGYITQSDYETALAEDIYAEVAANDSSVEADDTTNVHSYFEDALIEQIINDLKDKYNMTSQQASNVVYNGGITIKSTMDSRIQQIVDETYLNDSLFPDVKYCIEATYLVSIQDKTTGEVDNQEY
jgi:penicillin-binding protein 1A